MITFTTMTVHDVLDPNVKKIFNYLMLLVVFATWARLVFFVLVIASFSNILMTIKQMMGSGTDFFIILIMYLATMSTIFVGLFQDSAISYSNIFNATRTMFDAVLGSYQYSIRVKPINYTYIHSLLMMFHLYIANIFLLNYLVAILGNVYGDMGEKGTFFYKIYKYKYIERYTIAFKDLNGYSELIIHAPPINMFLIALLPFLTNKEKILKYSLLFSKVNFWFENIFLIIHHFCNEVYLMPVSYFTVLTGLYGASEM